MALAGYQYRVNGGSWVDIGLVTPPYVISTLPVGDNDIEVRAYDAAGNFAAPSNVATVTITGPSLPATSDLVIWNRTRDLVGYEKGDTVTSLPAISPTVREFIVGPQTPTYQTQQEGYPVIKLDGSNKMFTDANVTALTEWTVFIVFKKIDGTSAYILSAGDTNHAIIADFVAGKIEYYQTPRTQIDDVTEDVMQVFQGNIGTTTTGLWQLHETGGDIYFAEIFAYNRADVSDIQDDIDAYLDFWYGPQTLAVSTTELSSGGIGYAYSQELRSTGGQGQRTWSVSAGALPDGLSLSSDGMLTGTPTVEDTFNFTVQVTDEAAHTATLAFEMVITDANLFTLLPADLHDNVYSDNHTDYYRSSAFARAVFDTTANAMTVNLWSTVYSSFPIWATAGVYVDGEWLDYLQASGDGAEAVVLTLPNGSKRVEIVAGLQASDGAGGANGTFLKSVEFAGEATKIAPSTPATRVTVYGDSITVGANSDHPEHHGWALRLRDSRTESFLIEAWGSRSLYDDAHDSTARTAFVAKIAEGDPDIIWLAIGTNDYGLNKWAAASFGTAYAAVLDDLHTALPSAQIYCQTPIDRTTETANGSGSTLGNYRTQITTAVSTRTGFCTLVDGTAILSTGDLDDGVHPTTTGHGLYATYVDGVLG